MRLHSMCLSHSLPGWQMVETVFKGVETFNIEAESASKTA